MTGPVPGDQAEDGPYIVVRGAAEWAADQKQPTRRSRPRGQCPGCATFRSLVRDRDAELTIGTGPLWVLPVHYWPGGNDLGPCDGSGMPATS